jgi:hypothetical protein
MLSTPWRASIVLGTRITGISFSSKLRSSSLQMMMGCRVMRESAADEKRGKRAHLALSCRHLLQRALDLGVQRVLRHDEDDGQRLVDQRQWAVLELAGQNALLEASERVHVHRGVTHLGMDVRQLLDLQCRFQARRELEAAAHDQERLGVPQRRRRELLQGPIKLEPCWIWEGIPCGPSMSWSRLCAIQFGSS